MYVTARWTWFSFLLQTVPSVIPSVAHAKVKTETTALHEPIKTKTENQS